MKEDNFTVSLGYKDLFYDDLEEIFCIKQLPFYLHGQMTPEEQETFEQLLARCPLCQERLRLLQQEAHLVEWEAESLESTDREWAKTPKAEVWESESELWAAADTSETDDIRERIGAKFKKQGSMSLGPYTGRLYFLDQNSALLKFQQGNQPTSDLHGKIIAFYLIEESKEVEMPDLLSQTIQEGTVVIDFTRLGISIEDYARVGFKLYIDESMIIEGRLGYG